ncbi:MAG: gamma-glutamyl-gamma-aminobutyrate hydrolase family protein [Thiocapsa sp.]|jgi:GMP synthase-like glutamine amidotransferase|nr:gamma-glutamyl-gamma-aminobutyrate hydrolase family protein [Thiocapsa sp.]MCG6986123.1 gamma-glutamyl-gamma-aminobutyrate hydrolase family protein [Thiocapsa sp.]
MKVQVLQHVPFEDIGSMRPWLAARGATLGYTRFYADPDLPAPDGIDLVIAMGGPMSVNDEAELPWLRAEKAFLRELVARRVPMLGVCLGAQMIASALGARVYPNAEKEIGWFPVWSVPGGTGASADCFRFPCESRVFHWHGETFDLPPEAVRLASSAACANQAFQIGRHVIGLQFHLEATPESAAALIDHCRDELVAAPWIQTEAAIRAAGADVYTESNALMDGVLDYLTPPPGT